MKYRYTLTVAVGMVNGQRLGSDCGMIRESTIFGCFLRIFRAQIGPGRTPVATAVYRARLAARRMLTVTPKSPAPRVIAQTPHPQDLRLVHDDRGMNDPG
ncbi:MAG: hypothetical protein RQ741_13985 [Wenzhouxiangellaceae bacterium]|nr:hypothetical protein [Wenzhouxiangellaceae bacterium]